MSFKNKCHYLLGIILCKEEFVHVRPDWKINKMKTSISCTYFNICWKLMYVMRTNCSCLELGLNYYTGSLYSPMFSITMHWRKYEGCLKSKLHYLKTNNKHIFFINIYICENYNSTSMFLHSHLEFQYIFCTEVQAF